MKKTLLSAITVLALSAFTIFSGPWKNDPAHSQLGFTVTHLGVSDVSGTFNDFNVVINSTKADFSDATFELTAKAASIDTRVGMRNDHLKSPDFFDAEKYPTLSFKSTLLKKAGKDKYKLAGNLTIHGVTKPVTMDLSYNGTIEHPMNKKQVAGFTLSGTIKRSDFDLGAKFPAPMISDEVRIHASGEFTQN
jgi:polyisoprenoid-binding protein YceI